MTSLSLRCLIAVALLAACSDGVDPVPAGDIVGTLVETWAETEYEAEVLWAIDTPVLLSSTAERDAWLEDLPAELDVAAVAAVDMEDNVVVVGSYPRCDERGVVSYQGEGRLRFEAVEPPPREQVQCSWAPLHVEVWQLGRDELPAGDLTLVTEE